MANKKKFDILIPVENVLAIVLLCLLPLFPVLELLIRRIFKTGIPGSSDYVFHIVLWITFLGSMITSRENKHLALVASLDLIKNPLNRWLRTFNALVSTSITVAFFFSSLSFILIRFSGDNMVGIFPVQLVTVIMPAGFAVIAYRFISLSPPNPASRLVAVSGILIGTLLALSPLINILYYIFIDLPPVFDTITEIFYNIASVAVYPLFIILILSAFSGTPIFVVLGGLAYILFAGNMSPLEIIPNESYYILISDTLPAIPLFTFAGFLLSESKAGERLVRLFQAFFGWLPGGLAIMAVIVSAFFTTFTGATGVTILALGALLAFVLVNSGRYSMDFSNGLLTASGSIGLLFPPSLPIIMYSVVAQVGIKDMFIGGLVPGLLMVITLSVMGVISALKNRVERIPFKLKSALAAVRESIWEILLPVIILIGFFGGITNLIETAAVAVIYAFIIEVFVHQDIKLKQIPGVVLKCMPIIGGVLIILAGAKGLSYFIVDAEIPSKLSAWVEMTISSKYLFLFLLNIALLITGCLMDIFSATLVVVPLILPLSELFNIHPVHMGAIFLSNLGLGYLTPPVGLNLFLASYRFNQPLSRIYKNVVPFFLALLVAVLFITYLPWLSTGLLKLFGY
ncbi:MAG: TRAP transporter large permease subunit [Spirochaetota bacterium]